MARGTKIALAFLLVLFVGTGVYFTLTAPSPNPTGDLSSGGLTADGGLGTQSPADAAFPETIVLGPGTPEGPAIEVVAPPAGTEIDIFDQPAVDPTQPTSGAVTDLAGTGAVNGGGAPNGLAPATPFPVEPAAPVAATSTYTVASGDTLGGIAKKTYGRESAWTAIRDANPGVNPNNLKVGTALKLPAADQLPASEQVAAATKSSRGASRGSPAPAKKGGSKSTGTSGRRYTVKTGDTLWKIAKAEYGDGSLAQALLDYNKTVSADAAKLKIGSEWRIPDIGVLRPGAVASAKVASAEPAPKMAAKSAASYKVQKGDTPYAIAKKRGVKVAELLRHNGIKDPAQIKPGQTLKIPATY